MTSVGASEALNYISFDYHPASCHDPSGIRLVATPETPQTMSWVRNYLQRQIEAFNEALCMIKQRWAYLVGPFIMSNPQSEGRYALGKRNCAYKLMTDPLATSNHIMPTRRHKPCPIVAAFPHLAMAAPKIRTSVNTLYAKPSYSYHQFHHPEPTTFDIKNANTSNGTHKTSQCQLRQLEGHGKSPSPDNRRSEPVEHANDGPLEDSIEHITSSNFKRSKRYTSSYSMERWRNEDRDEEPWNGLGVKTLHESGATTVDPEDILGDIAGETWSAGLEDVWN